MSELGMSFEVCDKIPSAIQRLSERKFDNVIVDCDEADSSTESGIHLLSTLRQQANNQRAVAVGITSRVNQVQEVFNSGATFVLSKPLPIEDARRILRVSKGAITRAVRRFMRLEVDNLATVTIGDKYEAIILNVSQRGLQLQAPEPLQHGQMIYVSFLLPNTFSLIEGKAQVMWVDAEGRAGVELRTTSDEAQEALNDWVYARARALNPEFQYPANTGAAAAAKNKAAISSSSGNFKSSGFKTGSIDLQRLRAELAQPAQNLKKVRSAAVVIFGVILDMLAVGIGTGAFLAFAIFLSNYTGHYVAVERLIEIGLGVGIAFWLIYRFLYFFFNVASPGERAVQHMMAARQRAVQSRVSVKA